MLAYLRGERVGLVHDLGHEQPEGGGDVGGAHGACLHEEHVVLRSKLARLLGVNDLRALDVVLGGEVAGALPRLLALADAERRGRAGGDERRDAVAWAGKR